jgi:hypothetical protein
MCVNRYRVHDRSALSDLHSTTAVPPRRAPEVGDDAAQ